LKKVNELINIINDYVYFQNNLTKEDEKKIKKFLFDNIEELYDEIIKFDKKRKIC
jgi:hypothetical protein